MSYITSNAELNAHADISLNEWNRVVVQMHDGWVFWRRDMFPNPETGEFYDPETGEMYEPSPEELAYSRYCVCSQSTNFDLFVIVDESTVNPDQIFGSTIPPTETI